MTIVLVPDFALAELESVVADVVPEATLAPYGEGRVADIEDADAVLRWYGAPRFSEMVEHGPKVRWLHTVSAGLDHVLTPAVRAKQGLVVTDSGPAFEVAISEFVLAWMLMTARKLPQLLERQREHRWEGVKQRELFGATVGIIGLGPIGRGVAERAKAFGMRTLGLRRTDAPVPFVDQVLIGAEGLARLVSESDYVVIAAALTQETRAIVGKNQIAHMKPDSWLINIARGAMVDQTALTEALQAGRIGGACLDVFAEEPLPHESPLWDMPNVYIAPHNSSGGADGMAKRRRAIFVENLRRFCAGEPLENVVDIERGY